MTFELNNGPKLHSERYFQFINSIFVQFFFKIKVNCRYLRVCVCLKRFHVCTWSDYINLLIGNRALERFALSRRVWVLVIGLSGRDVSRCTISGFNIAWFETMNFSHCLWCSYFVLKIRKISLYIFQWHFLLKWENSLFPFQDNDQLCGSFQTKNSLSMSPKIWKSILLSNVRFKEMTINKIVSDKKNHSIYDTKWDRNKRDSMRWHSQNMIFHSELKRNQKSAWESVQMTFDYNKFAAISIHIELRNSKTEKLWTKSIIEINKEKKMRSTHNGISAPLLLRRWKEKKKRPKIIQFFFLLQHHHARIKRTIPEHRACRLSV